MAKENKILAIDIGGENLKMAEFYFPENGAGIQLTAFLFRKMEPLEGETPRALFDRYYHELLIEGRFTAHEVRLSLSSQNSFQRLSKLPPMLSSRGSVRRLIEYEASQAVPCAMSEVEWDYQLLHHEWEESVSTVDEEGNKQETMQKREEYESLFIAMKSEDVLCYTDVIEDSGKKLLSVEIAPVALFNAALASQIKEDECALLLNIGHSATSLMISDHRRIFMRNIPIGGDTITNQVAREFSVGHAEAEEFKRRYGFIALGGAYEDPESELAATISKIARNVMTRLHGEISRSISVWRAMHGGAAPTRVLLSGGGATMLYTTDFFQEKLRLPTEYLNSFGLISIADSVNREQLQAVAPMFQELIGLALHQRARCPIDISLLPRGIRKQMELDAKKPFFYASAIALISCLLIFLFGVRQTLSFEKERVSKVEAKVVEKEKEAKQIQTLAGQLNDLRGQYEEAVQLLQGRKKFSTLINALEQMIPDHVWLVTLEFDGEKKLSVGSSKVSTDDDMGMGMIPMMDDAPAARPAEKKAAKEEPGKQQTIGEINRLQEIGKIRLVGYALDNPEALGDTFSTFLERLKKSEIFEPETPIFRPDSTYNLTYFELTLKLKEPLKK